MKIFRNKKDVGIPLMNDDLTFFDETKRYSTGHHIFLACMPKSGSTFLSNVLSDVSGYKNVQFRIKPFDHSLEQDIYFPALIKFKDCNTITQQHTRGASSNFKMLRSINANILILTRNIFDVVISTYDHIENAKIIGSALAYGDYNYFKLSRDEKLNRIVDLVIPWHIHFFVSWYDRYETENYERMIWICYEEMISNEIDFFYNLCLKNDIICNTQRIEEIVLRIRQNSVKSRLNKGVHGRGEQLTEVLKNRIISYTNYYPHVDFSRIGIIAKAN